MRILLIAYVKGNLGDDLFIKEVVERYPNVEFYLNAEKEEYIKAFEKYSNMNIILEKRDLQKVNIDFYDAYIYVGGSIFVESVAQGKKRLEDFNNFIVKCKNKDKPFFYMSSNFGPYETNEYYETARKLFKNCTDICFRDKYSTNLFKDLDTVRYAPDIVFSLDFNQKEVIKNTIGISMLDVTKVKGLQNKEKEYYEFFERNITKYIDEGKEIYLFSFWKDAGEEFVIDTLLKRFSDKYMKKINVVKYRGNIDEFLNAYSKMEYMICIKFHSMILSTVFKQKKFVLSYLSKLNNVNKDLKLTKNMIDIGDIRSDLLINTSEFDKIEEYKLQEYIELSKRQFEKVDEYIMRHAVEN